MSELLGGERIVITSGRRNVHVFERTMSTRRQAMLEAGEEDFIDVWRLVTPLSGKQKARLDAAAPMPKVDRTASLDAQIQTVAEAVRLQKFREDANSRTRSAKISRIEGDTLIEYYELGYGIPTVRTHTLWSMLDRLYLNSVQDIDAKALTALITRPNR